MSRAITPNVRRWYSLATEKGLTDREVFQEGVVRIIRYAHKVGNFRAWDVEGLKEGHDVDEADVYSMRPATMSTVDESYSCR